MSKAGGHARAKSLTAERRREIASSAAKARWSAPREAKRISFPWDVVKGWSVTSRADGTLLIEPDYINPYHGPEEGGGPGLFTRMKLADWVLDRLCKRKRAPSAPMNSSTGTNAVIVSQEVVWERSPTPSAQGNPE